MSTIEDLRHVGRWLARLGGVTRQGDTALDAQTIADLAEMLADDFPASAFTTGSLKAVAAASEWFPAYAVIKRVVGEWWAENRPVMPAIAGPAGLAQLDQAWLNYWAKRKAENFSGSSPARVLSLIRTQSYPAYEVITGGDRPTRACPDRAQAAVGNVVRMWGG